MESKIYIGTSGWYYEHWKEVFYPKEVKTNDRLKYFSNVFSTIEINNTFYHLPTEKAVKEWALKVPNHFIFSVKASGYITHRKRLKEFDVTSPTFFNRVTLLGDKLGVILFQLPPSFEKNLDRLEECLRILDKKYSCAFEFRHQTWFSDDVYDLLKKYSVALCISDLKGNLSPTEITSKFTYIRLHGPKQAAYQGFYGTHRLKEWQKRIEQWKQKKISVYCYFDNDEKAYAVKDALELKSLLQIP